MKNYEVEVLFIVKAADEDAAQETMHRILLDVERETQLPEWTVNDAEEAWWAEDVTYRIRVEGGETDPLTNSY